MTSRIGPIVVAIASMAARIAGEPAIADFVAVSALGALTLVLYRSTALQRAARTAHTLNSLMPSGTGTAYPVAN